MLSGADARGSVTAPPSTSSLLASKTAASSRRKARSPPRTSNTPGPSRRGRTPAAHPKSIKSTRVKDLKGKEKRTHESSESEERSEEEGVPEGEWEDEDDGRISDLYLEVIVTVSTVESDECGSITYHFC
jgi:hypothetical protein